MTAPVIPFEAGEARLDWLELTAALEAGHRLPKAEIGDTFLRRGNDTMLSRAAWIDGMGLAVKTATVFPGNADLHMPSIHGGVNLFSDRDGTLDAIIDFHLVTKWKTAADSLLGALKLARRDSRNILIIGAGTVGHNLYQAYSAGFPDASFTVWNRTFSKAKAFADAHDNMVPASDLKNAVRAADIITSATMTVDPILHGDWLQPGQHVDLIGAYRADMREADDTVMRRARVFVDSRDTTMGHIGEIQIPLDTGVLTPDDIVADFYDLGSGRVARSGDDEITLFKNGGGAHLDLMTSRYILNQWNAP